MFASICTVAANQVMVSTFTWNFPGATPLEVQGARQLAKSTHSHSLGCAVTNGPFTTKLR